VVDAVKMEENVFFTGVAGTGKSLVLSEMVGQLKSRFGDDFKHKVAITAATGIAALAIEGQVRLRLRKLEKCFDANTQPIIHLCLGTALALTCCLSPPLAHITYPYILICMHECHAMP
jgi:hypothetical protein